MDKPKKSNISLRNNLLSWVLFLTILLFMIVTCFFAIGFFSIKRDINSNKNEIDSINKKIAELQTDSHTEKELTITEEDFHKYYIELSDKADDGMNKLLTVVGIIATTYTVFGALFIFKAPREIEKKIEEIDKSVSETKIFAENIETSAKEAMNLATEVKASADEAKDSAKEAKDSAEEAKYLTEILDALTNEVNGPLTNFDKLRNLSNVINKYPDRSSAYMEKGFIYNKMGKYSEAIEEYENALERGADKAKIYNAMGIAYNDKGDNDKAIEDYSKAIKLDENYANAYNNRGIAYDDKGEYDKAIEDYTKAISLDCENWRAYQGRGLAYKNLMKKEKDQAKKEELRKLMEADFKKAEELKPKGE